MPNTFFQLTLPKIEACRQIQIWLSQFSSEDQEIAKNMLLRLKFVSSEKYKSWLMSALDSLDPSAKCGLYAARKLGEEDSSLWQPEGMIIQRPGSSQGSEDFVYSIINNQSRIMPDVFFDHPSLSVLKRERIHHIIIIDDSVGTGGRISEYIKAFFHNKTLLSWWSYGLLKLYVISYSRSKESEESIMKSLPGKNSPIGIKKKVYKVEFISHDVFYTNSLNKRWGDECYSILDFCNRQKNVKKYIRCGYKKTMSNIIFYHSVPNNVPGIFWYSNEGKFTALFPNRITPEWMISLLENFSIRENSHSSLSTCTSFHIQKVNPALLQVLRLIKKGIHVRKSLAYHLEIDPLLIDHYLTILQEAGLISLHNRITPAGVDALTSNRTYVKVLPDFKLYVPRKWRIV